MIDWYDLAGAAGLVFIVVGCVAVSVPLALVVVGLALIGVGVFGARRRAVQRGPGSSQLEADELMPRARGGAAHGGGAKLREGACRPPLQPGERDAEIESFFCEG
jgi:hypothetical protein